jgi:taurine transport system ATP-binding protein
MSGLVLDNISMRFDLPNGDHVQALQDVSMNIKSGELMSVLGPSGCGKTTLLNIIAGFLAATGGKVMLNDHLVTGPAQERGMVFQKGALFEWMNVRENVSFGPRMNGIPKSESDPKVDHSRKRRLTNCPAACSSASLWPVALPTSQTSS